MRDRLYEDPRLARFYDLQNGWASDFDFCANLAEEAGSVLDLGCGTGQLAAALSETRRVTGVDPADAMLQIARRRPGGGRVTWIEGDARTLRLDDRFDLIVLTGHAFQVFLTEDDQRAVLKTIAAHLSENGCFVFDSRNPTHRAWQRWTPEQSREYLNHPDLGRIETWTDASLDAATGVVTYSTLHRVAATGEVFDASSRIRFTPKDALTRLIDEAGLAVERWMGDWTGAPWTADSAEIIPQGRLR